MPPLIWDRLFKKKEANSSDILAIALSKEGFCLARLLLNGAEPPTLLHSQFYTVRKEDRAQELASLAASLNLSGLRCRLVLAADDYRMLQAQAPEVPEEEIRDALRWSVQDMLDFPVTEAEIEYYRMPSSRQTGGGASMTVVVCASSLVRSYIAMCESAKLRLEEINIPEMSLRNLAAQLPENQRGVALLCLGDESGIVQLQKDGVIYISRKFDFGVHKFASGFDDSTIDILALEIQRSLDYYESYFSMPPVARLVVAPISGNTQNLVDSLNHALGIKTSALDIMPFVSCDEPLDDAAQQRCLLAIGAVLSQPDAVTEEVSH